MKLFLFFLLTCFFTGMLLPPRMRLARAGWVLAGFCAAVASGYFFLRMI